MSVEADEFGASLGAMIYDAMREAQNTAPRTLQSQARVLGMSELGGCREYIRASVAGEPKSDRGILKWPAAVGTAVGDWAENAVLAMFPDAVTQETVSLTLPKSGITVTGHLDVRGGRSFIADFKTKDGLADVRRKGSSFKEKVQVAGYLIAAMQADLVDDDATAHLVYLDRSGKEIQPYVVSIDVEQAHALLAAVEERLDDVARALAAGEGQSYLRDEPESWCFNVGCPFYSACWAGYEPSQEITHPKELQAVQEFVEARAAEQEAVQIRATKREALRGIEGRTVGLTPEWVVRWSVTQGKYGDTEKLEVREA